MRFSLCFVRRSLFDPEGGMRDVRALDSISFTDWFKSHGGSQASIDRMWDPIGAFARVVIECVLLLHACVPPPLPLLVLLPPACGTSLFACVY